MSRSDPLNFNCEFKLEFSISSCEIFVSSICSIIYRRRAEAERSLIEISLNGTKLSLNSLNSAHSGNLPKSPKHAIRINLAVFSFTPSDALLANWSHTHFPSGNALVRYEYGLMLCIRAHEKCCFLSYGAKFMQWCRSKQTEPNIFLFSFFLLKVI